jgi:predicted DNA-binding transcriptional regulator YafY
MRASNRKVPSYSLVLDKSPADLICEKLTLCIRARKSVEIYYISKNASSENPRWRRISPHTFCFDGFRMFLRAFCHDDRRFKDFVLVRCLKARQARRSDYVGKRSDRKWNEVMYVTLTANPKLELDQCRAIEHEFLCGKRHRTLKVRRALLPYFVKRLRLETAKSPSGRKRKALILSVK